MIVAHIMGIPIEESVLQLAPAGAATVTPSRSPPARRLAGSDAANRVRLKGFRTLEPEFTSRPHPPLDVGIAMGPGVGGPVAERPPLPLARTRAHARGTGYPPRHRDDGGSGLVSGARRCDGLCEVRGMLLAEHAWRKSAGLT